MKIKVYNIDGSEAENLTINFDSLLSSVNLESIKQYLRVYLANQRQGTSKVKTKSEVSGGGRKPWRQKGTGRARSGSSRSPLWVGGGVTHGPTPKDWSLKMSKSLNSLAFKSSLMDVALKNNIAVIDITKDLDKKISTKKADALLAKIGLADKKILVVTSNKLTETKNNEIKSVFKSFRNIKKVNVREADNVNTYDLVNTEFVLLEKVAINSLETRLK